jgi:hypothetical protein
MDPADPNLPLKFATRDALAALPWIGVLMAARSAWRRAVMLALATSGRLRWRPRMVRALSPVSTSRE